MSKGHQCDEFGHPETLRVYGHRDVRYEGGSQLQEPGLSALRCVVAVPVRNEVDRISDCLRALDGQVEVGTGGVRGRPVLNNCTDGTAHVVAALRERLPILIRVVEREFADANAGWADARPWRRQRLA